MSAKRIDLTQLDGLATYQDTLRFLQDAIQTDVGAIAAALGTKIILTGVVDQGGSVTDGFVIINGELLPFVGGVKSPKVFIEEISDVELFADTTVKTVYFTRRARMGNVGDFDLTELRRWKTDAINIDDSEVLASAKAVKKLNDYILSAFGFENRMIIKGCEVANVNTGASTLDIATGLAVIDGAIITTPAYSGLYPVYLKADATYTTVDPGGINIKFDPYTSQRYADVLKRATTGIGEVKMFKTLNDRFDINGVGKWEMTGFKICDDMRSRVPLGYDRRMSDPFDGIWDANYNNPGNVGGEKAHTLLSAEQGKIDVAQKREDVDGGTSHVTATIKINNVEVPANGAENQAGYGTTTSIPAKDALQAHNNVQPYRVLVFVERI